MQSSIHPIIDDSRSEVRRRIEGYINETLQATGGGSTVETVEPIGGQSLEDLELERDDLASYNGVSFQNPLKVSLKVLEQCEIATASMREAMRDGQSKDTANFDSATDFELREFDRFLYRLKHWSKETDDHLRWASNVIKTGVFNNRYNAVFNSGSARGGWARANAQAMFEKNKETELWETTGIEGDSHTTSRGREAIDSLLRESADPSRAAVIIKEPDESESSSLSPSIEGTSSKMDGNELFVSMINCLNTNTRNNPSALKNLLRNIDRIPASDKDHKAVELLKEDFTRFHDFCKRRDEDVECHRDFKRDYEDGSCSEQKSQDFTRDPIGELNDRTVVQLDDPASASEDKPTEHWYRMKLHDYANDINHKLIKAGGSLRNESDRNLEPEPLYHVESEGSGRCS
ncbi:hypothetical protein I302_105010 [Kwoniella bestiolae CBS 10118]|uniref:Uncharacterized protein n=1 Tax=Kwoniella bestiolae CBS 10118 TaxID=1296100 RepID=A0A1B9FR51_9TREE|nr:hypothetical protein I302_08917 [Kwoniella bestiolae CBS 10118]OCF21245.1 hypothetical protein I302_08917 [Kwoniella bestiolae CBS 10118]